MANHNSRTARKRQVTKKKKSIWKKMLLVLMTIFLIAILGVGGVFGYYVATAPKLDIDKLNVAYSSQFLDMDGEVFADIGTENRKNVKYEELPEVLINAVTATEDARFFQHPGIDVRRIGGAVVANIKHGFGSEGASTITQQVVENMFLTPEKKIKLKVQEQWLALKLEREYSKEQILEMYLNKIFYGSNAYGVAKAAEVYFGVENLEDLTLVQAAMLAGLPQRPSAYNPFENPDLMQERVDTVLTLMVRHNKISEEEAEEARAIDVASVLTDKKPRSLPYEAFRQQAIAELEEKLPDVDVFSAGLEIHTNLDASIQEHVEFLLTDSDSNPIPYPDKDLQAGMSVVDTQTGEIRAIGGSRNRENVMGDNYAIKLERQPGSTIKPILSYGPAIDYEKWSTYEQINDDKPYVTGSGHEIRNWNRKYQGWMSARTALKHSYNVPAVKTFMEIGPDRAKKFAENLGIEFADKHLGPQDAIGGAATTVTPLQLAGAFSAFGNEGIYTEPHAVSKVVFPDGSVVDLKPSPEAAMADYTAYMVTDMLKDVLKSGTGTNANISHLPVAGKTGTTNVKGKTGANNSWFAGYTTNYSIGIWTGYSNEHNRVMPNTQIPHALFKNTMTEISKDIETADFKKPDSVVELSIEKGSNPAKLASEFTPSSNIVKELFVKGTEPSAVSKKFEKLDPVSNLTASYNESGNKIDVKWDYNNEDNIVFDVNFAIDSASKKKLTTTTDRTATIDNIELGSSYTIEVIAMDEDSGLKSDPVSVTVNLEEEEDEEIPAVSNLNGNYHAESRSIDVTWNYDGPSGAFEVTVNGGQAQTVNQNSFKISDITPSEAYTVTVTAIANDTRSESKSVTIKTEAVEEEPDNENDNNEENNDNNDSNQGGNNEEDNENGNNNQDEEVE
ncbi:MAG TPA: PBP1A family penicillin-binding protein [Pseudogracilibacillus sp.]|nr:PBP1A family penicillin-binding protein [Pseudogracilibacillus sp.]